MSDRRNIGLIGTGRIGSLHARNLARRVEFREFADCVRNDRTPPVTGNDGRMAVVCGFAAIKSLKENRPVRLSEIVR